MVEEITGESIQSNIHDPEEDARAAVTILVKKVRDMKDDAMANLNARLAIRMLQNVADEQMKENEARRRALDAFEEANRRRALDALKDFLRRKATPERARSRSRKNRVKDKPIVF